MRTPASFMLALLLGATVAAGCSDDSDDDTGSGAPSGDTGGAGDAPIDGGDGGSDIGVFTVGDAVGAGDTGEIQVSGTLILLQDGTATMCGGAIAESAPPQCGDPALPVDGLAFDDDIDGLDDYTTWRQGEVTLTGTVTGGRLSVP